MQITKAGEYGVLGLLNLARRGAGAVVMVDEVSREEAIPASFLRKIFQTLVRAGLLHSVRGAKGGFSMGRPADTITVLEVIEAIEGPIALQPCLDEPDDCAYLPGCALCGLWGEAQEGLRAVLARRTLAELARRQLPRIRLGGSADPAT
jgi:Rrf2 family protein